MNKRRVRLKITGDVIEMEVDGARGTECMSLTEFLTSAPGVTVNEQYVTSEYAERKVPVEVKI